MAGHNKWSKVKHIKGAADAKRGKLFSKLSKEITVAARLGGGDADLNPRLRVAINNAKAQNMPGDTIDRALKKGTGELEGVTYEEALYEGYGPGGIAMMVEVLTDNKNRSAAAARHLFSKNNGSFAEAGSVAYLFDRKGEIRVSTEQADSDRMLELVLESGAEDLESYEDEHIVVTASESFAEVAKTLKEAGLETAGESLAFRPQNTIAVEDPATAKSVLRLYELLDDWEDAQNVYANFEIPDALLEELSAEEG